jgi:hypothetical protein
MTLRRTSLTLGLERDSAGPGGASERIRISATYDAGEDPSSLGLEELRSALARLREELDGIAGGRTGERPLDELVETYRPRQAELVDLLREEGEISGPEAERLQGYLAQLPAAAEPPRPMPSDLPPPTDRPIAAMPLENDRTPTTPRPVALLLDQYRIETLKQAGAVRARRQISFEEYMALKRHFSAAPVPVTPGPSP